MMDGSDWAWGSLMMVVVWGGLAALILISVRAFGSRSPRAPRETETHDPKAILEARFAKGDISEEEFERAKSVLGLAAGAKREHEGAVAGTH